MYQQIQIEFQPAFVPAIGDIEAYQINSSTYFIRGLFSPGHYPFTSLYARLGDLERYHHIRRLHHFVTCGGCRLDRVFFFDAPNCLPVMRVFACINEACVKGRVHPLPDLEFVHPAAHALLYSLGGFSGSSADCYLCADPNAVDLNQKVQ